MENVIVRKAYVYAMLLAALVTPIAAVIGFVKSGQPVLWGATPVLFFVVLSVFFAWLGVSMLKETRGKE